MQNTQTQVIDGLTYTTTQFSATKGIKMLHRVGKYVAGPLSKLAPAMKGGGINADVDPELLGGAIQSFFQGCPEHELETTIKDLLSTTTCDGKAINFDLDFAGKLGHLFKVLAFVLRVQFGNFMQGIGENRA